VGPIEPEFFDSDEMRAALTARDIATVYRLLGRLGVSQRRIAQLTGQSQSEVCEILNGRQVRTCGYSSASPTVSAYPGRGWA